MLSFAILTVGVAVANAAISYDDHYRRFESPYPAAKAGPCNIKLTGGDAEGPYYKPYAPFQPQAPEVPSICKSSLVNERVFISGNVSKLLQSGPSGDVCQLVGTKVLLDLWAADPNGEYSNISPLSPDYWCRMRIYSKADGSFTFASTYPGRYGGNGLLRPAHIHVKITPVDQFNRPLSSKPFTTQMYFDKDVFNYPNDMCEFCNSGEHTQKVSLDHTDDYKTFYGTWNVVIA